MDLDEGDRYATRLVWFNDNDPSNPDGLLQVIRCTAVLFGAIRSPFTLNSTIIKHLKSTRTGVAVSLRRDLYVDNIIRKL